MKYTTKLGTRVLSESVPHNASPSEGNLENCGHNGGAMQYSVQGTQARGRPVGGKSAGTDLGGAKPNSLDYSTSRLLAAAASVIGRARQTQIMVAPHFSDRCRSTTSQSIHQKRRLSHFTCSRTVNSSSLRKVVGPCSEK